MIAAAAEKYLSKNAKKRVGQLLAPLGPDGTLPAVAPWADLVKRHSTAPSDPDTQKFLSDARNIGPNPNAPEYVNGRWHYADIPLGCDSYDPTRYPSFTRDDDIVHVLAGAVNSLQGETDRFSPINALRLVIHLVGDVHQPLHVGCSFLQKRDSSAEIVTDPETIVTEHLVSDRGGNALILPIGAGIALHSYWDSKLGGPQPMGFAADSFDSGDVQRFVDRIAVVRAHATTLTATATAVDITTEATRWAGQSLVAARVAYKGLKVDTLKPHTTSYTVTWDGRQVYDDRCASIVTERMTSAASNLADLLNAVL
jgi:hypothetical protein